MWDEEGAESSSTIGAQDHNLQNRLALGCWWKSNHYVCPCTDGSLCLQGMMGSFSHTIVGWVVAYAVVWWLFVPITPPKDVHSWVINAGAQSEVISSGTPKLLIRLCTVPSSGLFHGDSLCPMCGVLCSSEEVLKSIWRCYDTYNMTWICPKHQLGWSRSLVPLLLCQPILLAWHSAQQQVHWLIGLIPCQINLLLIELAVVRPNWCDKLWRIPKNLRQKDLWISGWGRPMLTSCHCFASDIVLRTRL